MAWCFCGGRRSAIVSGRPLVVVGSSGHGRVVADAAALSGFEVLGFLDDFTAPGATSGRWSILGNCNLLPTLRSSEPALAVAIGIGHNRHRRTVAERIRNLCPDIDLASVLHPSAIISQDASIGEGSFVAAGAVIQTAALVQALSLINTKAIVEHDAQTGIAASLGPGAIIGGWSRIGDEAALQLGALLRDKRTVGDFTVVGMGSVVTGDLPACCVAWGNPARWQRSRSPADPVL